MQKSRERNASVSDSHHGPPEREGDEREREHVAPSEQVRELAAADEERGGLWRTRFERLL
jgi:hypothetical protein